MFRVRVIPVLLIENRKLVKSRNFRKPRYVGDPINVVKIFNEKEVDEIVFLETSVSRLGLEPPFTLIEELASECFMPICYGGGITTLDQMQRIFRSGVEKVALNTSLLRDPELIKAAAEKFGRQSIVASIDVKRGWFGEAIVYSQTVKRKPFTDAVAFARYVETLGVGEILLTSVDHDGCLDGYDLALIKAVTAAVNIPVIACGGARHTADFIAAVRAGASAVAGGSLFVFRGRHFAVLIQFPTAEELEHSFFNQAAEP